MKKVIIIGAAGYVGSALERHLRANPQLEVIPITRENIGSLPNQLGHVIYAIGLTSDFRLRLHETIDAHVSVLSKIVRQREFQTLTYLSSTRVYRSTNSTKEIASISALPPDPDDIYTLSKLLGESIALNSRGGRMRVCRLSNVYGGQDDSKNFLNSILSDARASGFVRIRQQKESSKDYVHIDDVCMAIEAITFRGEHSIYNVASGINVSHHEIANVLTNSGALVEFGTEPAAIFNRINIERLQQLVSWEPKRLIEQLPKMLLNFSKGGARAVD